MGAIPGLGAGLGAGAAAGAGGLGSKMGMSPMMQKGITGLAQGQLQNTGGQPSSGMGMAGLSNPRDIADYFLKLAMGNDKNEY